MKSTIKLLFFRDDHCYVGIPVIGKHPINDKGCNFLVEATAFVLLCNIFITERQYNVLMHKVSEVLRV